MLVLHGSWVPDASPEQGQFVIWAESAERWVMSPGGWRDRSPNVAPVHPFAATPEEVWSALCALGAVHGPGGPRPGQVRARIPSAGGDPIPSPELGGVTQAAQPEAPAISEYRLPCLVLGAGQAVSVLIEIAGAELPPGLLLGDDLRFWLVANRFFLELMVRQRFLPGLRWADASLNARWQPMIQEEMDVRRLGLLTSSMPAACRALGWEGSERDRPPGHLFSGYLAAATDALAREAVAGLPVAVYEGVQAAQRHELVRAWLAALSGEPVLRGKARELRVFYDSYRSWNPAADRDYAGPSDSFRVCFRLDPPGPVAALAESEPWRLHFLLQATDDPSLLVPAGEVWRQRGGSVQLLERRLDHPHERFLQGLGRASRIFPPIERGLRSPRPQGCTLSIEEAGQFMQEGAYLLREAGFGVLVPRLQTRLSLRLKFRGREVSRESSGLLGWDSLVDFDWEVALGGQTLSREEFEALARMKQPLVQVRGQWVELRPDQLQRALELLQERAHRGQITVRDALQTVLAPDGSYGLPVAEVRAEGWLEALLQQLGRGEQREQVAEPPGFVGQLRGYQKAGVAWLAALRRYGLGACLADDMGLGKTVQVIALLLHWRWTHPDDAPAPVLLVCPTSVVGNWCRELERFAPSLRVLVYHGVDRGRDQLAEEATRHDVVISTYSLLHRDEAALSGLQWAAVVLDEAQNIKNPSTKAARAARKLATCWRVALTGTPVENRLVDLWSIFDFLNPGYLGSAEEFSRLFAAPIERAGDRGAADRLKRLVAPFILRRVKTDPSIIQDLPEKNEMKVFCSLTREQATLYQAVLQDSLRQIEEAEGIRRRGLVLATLTKLKQVCDHPALFLHDGSSLGERSGKLVRLCEMLEEVLAVGERALIFTQYAEMGRMLQEHLEATFGREVLFLHGGVAAAERDRMVTRFQGDSRAPHLFVLSLRAGGTGLNLTSANHVFHFDRWWNPAVENQATDRAFRIGQRRNVQVHKFICIGTFEEALDSLIDKKVDLAQRIVGTGETWITEMSTEELRQLFTLRSEALLDN